MIVWPSDAKLFVSLTMHLQGDHWDADAIGIFELVVDACFMFDIYLNFRTAYYDSRGNLVANRRRIALHYIKGWFIIDAISVVPFDLITAGAMGFLSMLKVS